VEVTKLGKEHHGGSAVLLTLEGCDDSYKNGISLASLATPPSKQSGTAIKGKEKYHNGVGGVTSISSNDTEDFLHQTLKGHQARGDGINNNMKPSIKIIQHNKEKEEVPYATVHFGHINILNIRINTIKAVVHLTDP
jgi:hypothetical protein